MISQVEELTKNNPVIIFMKGTPDFPQCGFSNRAVQVLKAAGVENVKGVDVLSDEPLWEALEEFTNFAVEVYKDPDHDPKKQTEKLKRAIYGILEKRGIDGERELIPPNEPTPTCRL